MNVLLYLGRLAKYAPACLSWTLSEDESCQAMLEAQRERGVAWGFTSGVFR